MTFTNIDLYFHMKNHYKKIKNAKAVVDCSCPKGCNKKPCGCKHHRPTPHCGSPSPCASRPSLRSRSPECCQHKSVCVGTKSDIRPASPSKPSRPPIKKPSSPAVKKPSSQAIKKPSSPTIKPVSPSTKAVGTATKPVCPEAQPVCPGAQPVCPGAQRVCPGPKPVCPGAQRVCPGPQPVCPGAQRVCPGPQPVCPGAQRVCPGPQPVCPKAEPFSPAARQLCPAAIWAAIELQQRCRSIPACRRIVRKDWNCRGQGPRLEPSVNKLSLQIKPDVPCPLSKRPRSGKRRVTKETQVNNDPVKERASGTEEVQEEQDAPELRGDSPTRSAEELASDTEDVQEEQDAPEPQDHSPTGSAKDLELEREEMGEEQDGPTLPCRSLTCPKKRRALFADELETQDADEEQDAPDQRCRPPTCPKRLGKAKSDPGRVHEEVDMESAEAEEHEYIYFLLKITEDILRNNLYSDEQMTKLFESHIEANRGRLSEARMRAQIEHLKKELNLPLSRRDCECDDETDNKSIDDKYCPAFPGIPGICGCDEPTCPGRNAPSKEEICLPPCLTEQPVAADPIREKSDESVDESDNKSADCECCPAYPGIPGICGCCDPTCPGRKTSLQKESAVAEPIKEKSESDNKSTECRCSQAYKATPEMCSCWIPTCPARKAALEKETCLAPCATEQPVVAEPIKENSGEGVDESDNKSTDCECCPAYPGIPGICGCCDPTCPGRKGSLKKETDLAPSAIEQPVVAEPIKEKLCECSDESDNTSPDCKCCPGYQGTGVCECNNPTCPGRNASLKEESLAKEEPVVAEPVNQICECDSESNDKSTSTVEQPLVVEPIKDNLCECTDESDKRSASLKKESSVIEQPVVAEPIKEMICECSDESDNTSPDCKCCPGYQGAPGKCGCNNPTCPGRNVSLKKVPCLPPCEQPLIKEPIKEKLCECSAESDNTSTDCKCCPAYQGTPGICGCANPKCPGRNAPPKIEEPVAPEPIKEKLCECTDESDKRSASLKKESSVIEQPVVAEPIKENMICECSDESDKTSPDCKCCPAYQGTPGICECNNPTCPGRNVSLKKVPCLPPCLKAEPVVAEPVIQICERGDKSDNKPISCTCCPADQATPKECGCCNTTCPGRQAFLKKETCLPPCLIEQPVVAEPKKEMLCECSDESDKTSPDCKCCPGYQGAPGKCECNNPTCPGRKASLKKESLTKEEPVVAEPVRQICECDDESERPVVAEPIKEKICECGEGSDNTSPDCKCCPGYQGAPGKCECNNPTCPSRNAPPKKEICLPPCAEGEPVRQICECDDESDNKSQDFKCCPAYPGTPGICGCGSPTCPGLNAPPKKEICLPPCLKEEPVVVKPQICECDESGNTTPDCKCCPGYQGAPGKCECNNPTCPGRNAPPKKEPCLPPCLIKQPVVAEISCECVDEESQNTSPDCKCCSACQRTGGTCRCSGPAKPQIQKKTDLQKKISVCCESEPCLLEECEQYAIKLEKPPVESDFNPLSPIAENFAEGALRMDQCLDPAHCHLAGLSDVEVRSDKKLSPVSSNKKLSPVSSRKMQSAPSTQSMVKMKHKDDPDVESQLIFYNDLGQDERCYCSSALQRTALKIQVDNKDEEYILVDVPVCMPRTMLENKTVSVLLENVSSMLIEENLQESKKQPSLSRVNLFRQQVKESTSVDTDEDTKDSVSYQIRKASRMQEKEDMMPERDVTAPRTKEPILKRGSTKSDSIGKKTSLHGSMHEEKQETRDSKGFLNKKGSHNVCCGCVDAPNVKIIECPSLTNKPQRKDSPRVCVAKGSKGILPTSSSASVKKIESSSFTNKPKRNRDSCCGNYASSVQKVESYSHRLSNVNVCSRSASPVDRRKVCSPLCSIGSAAKLAETVKNNKSKGSDAIDSRPIKSSNAAKVAETTYVKCNQPKMCREHSSAQLNAEVACVRKSNTSSGGGNKQKSDGHCLVRSNTGTFAMKRETSGVTSDKLKSDHGVGTTSATNTTVCRKKTGTSGVTSDKGKCDSNVRPVRSHTVCVKKISTSVCCSCDIDAASSNVEKSVKCKRDTCPNKVKRQVYEESDLQSPKGIKTQVTEESDLQSPSGRDINKGILESRAAKVDDVVDGDETPQEEETFDSANKYHFLLVDASTSTSACNVNPAEFELEPEPELALAPESKPLSKSPISGSLKERSSEDEYAALLDGQIAAAKMAGTSSPKMAESPSPKMAGPPKEVAILPVATTEISSGRSPSLSPSPKQPSDEGSVVSKTNSVVYDGPEEQPSDLPMFQSSNTPPRRPTPPLKTPRKGTDSINQRMSDTESFRMRPPVGLGQEPKPEQQKQLQPKLSVSRDEPPLPGPPVVTKPSDLSSLAGSQKPHEGLKVRYSLNREMFDQQHKDIIAKLDAVPKEFEDSDKKPEPVEEEPENSLDRERQASVAAINDKMREFRTIDGDENTNRRFQISNPENFEIRRVSGTDRENEDEEASNRKPPRTCCGLVQPPKSRKKVTNSVASASSSTR